MSHVGTNLIRTYVSEPIGQRAGTPPPSRDMNTVIEAPRPEFHFLVDIARFLEITRARMIGVKFTSIVGYSAS